MKPSSESTLKLRIADKYYDLILVPERSKDDGVNNSASCSQWYQKIRISVNDRMADGIMGDLWHEVTEAINNEYNLGLNHQTITTIGSAIHQVLRDNPNILLEITKKGEH